MNHKKIRESGIRAERVRELIREIEREEKAFQEQIKEIKK